jgi:hypothetical protein
MKIEQLTALFGRLGAPDPELWARSQVTEGIPQLQRFLFLRQAWREVVADGDVGWIEQEKQTNPGGPGGAIAPALERVLAAGARPEDLTDIARVMQWRTLFSLCCLLDDPGDIEPEVADICWALFQVDQEGKPMAEISGLHESVLETDPTGREMFPKPSH